MSDKIDFKAFEDGRADQLLRETMAGHRIEPAPRLWKGISRKLLWKELIRFNFANLSPKYWIAGTTVLLLVFTSLYFGIPDSAPVNRPEQSANVITNVSFSSGKQVSKPVTGMLTTPDQKSLEEAVTVNQPDDAPSVEKSIKHSFDAGNKSMPVAKGINPTSNKASSDESELLSEESDHSNYYVVGKNISVTAPPEMLHIVPYEATLLSEKPAKDTILTFSNSAVTMKFRKNRPGANRFFSANLGITPELAFYDEPDVYSKTNFWFNAGVTYHISRFSVATGFDLGYVYDEGKYKVEYKSRDSVGYFNGVTSFIIGSNNEIIYNTQAVNVYDSLQHLSDYRTKNRYSYLQIPLLLGYRIFESGWASITFQAGPSVSFLLGTRKSDPVIEYRNARIIRVDDNTPERIHVNWQIWANLYFEMRMNKLVSIYLQPSFKYYLKPMVFQENVTYKAPWTIGLGVGLQFNFGQKKTKP